MIAFLKGVLAAKTATTAFIEVNGVDVYKRQTVGSESRLPSLRSPVLRCRRCV